MEQQLIEMTVKDSIFAALFLFLLIYVLKTTGEREKKNADREERYIVTIQHLSQLLNENSQQQQKLLECLDRLSEQFERLSEQSKKLCEDISEVKQDVREIKREHMQGVRCL